MLKRQQMLRTITATILALGLLTHTFGDRLEASELNVGRAKKLTEPLAVFLGAGGGVAFEDVAVRQLFMKKPAQYSLVLNLEEVRENGDVVFLGEQEVVLSGLPIVTQDGPNGRTVVQVGWDTAPVEFLSDVNACVYVMKLDSVVADVECRVLNPL